MRSPLQRVSLVFVALLSAVLLLFFHLSSRYNTLVPSIDFNSEFDEHVRPILDGVPSWTWGAKGRIEDDDTPVQDDSISHGASETEVPLTPTVEVPTTATGEEPTIEKASPIDEDHVAEEEPLKKEAPTYGEAPTTGHSSTNAEEGSLMDEEDHAEEETSTKEAEPTEEGQGPIAKEPSRPLSEAPQALPQCKRTLLVHLRGSRGFASEFNRFLRLAAVGEHFGYEVVLGDELNWMYGHYEDYFVKPTLPCSMQGLPGAGRKGRPRITEGDEIDGRPAWTKYDHIQDGTDTSFEYLDSLFLSFTTSNATLPALHAAEIEAYPPSLPLNGFRTVPIPLYGSFKVLSEQARKWWRPNAETRALVDSLRRGLDWDRADRPSIVGMHVRLGDKCAEVSNPKYSPLRFAEPAIAKSKLRNAKDCELLSATGGMDGSQAKVYLDGVKLAFSALRKREGQQKVLAVMSDDVEALAKIDKDSGDEQNFSSILLQDAAKTIRGAEKSMEVEAELNNGFSIGKFQSLSDEGRVEATRQFIRDITLIAETAEAIVFTGSSNVGRLAIVLAGPEKAVEGRYISCDSRWFPTAYFN